MSAGLYAPKGVADRAAPATVNGTHRSGRADLARYSALRRCVRLPGGDRLEAATAWAVCPAPCGRLPAARGATRKTDASCIPARRHSFALQMITRRSNGRRATLQASYWPASFGDGIARDSAQGLGILEFAAKCPVKNSRPHCFQLKYCF
jgi:hypothetical protein